jgi:hypothetical protein
MANYCAVSRSNYHKVKDNEAFERFCGDLELGCPNNCK